MKRITVGILAHVDAGKTTLSEALLHESGMLNSMGRVDDKNSFLDTDEQERERGITIFSKQAVINYRNMSITLLDTPGHVDFSAEMERTLWVLDYAILVISASDGVQGHTYTLWKLLKRYNIPTFIFINKMDRECASEEALMEQLKAELCNGFVDFSLMNSDDENKRHEFLETIAVCDDDLLERYLEGAEIENGEIAELISRRKVFPCYFGAAIKPLGVKEFLDGLVLFSNGYSDDDNSDETSEKEGAACGTSDAGFGARVYKIAKSQKGERLTYMKITSGILRVKQMINDEKADQIRIYSGEKFEGVKEAYCGQVCAVLGLNDTYPGQGVGAENDSGLPVLEPVLTYAVKLPEDVDANVMLARFRELEEEEPQLHVAWIDDTKSIEVKLMGEVQIEILKEIILNRFGINVEFGSGKIVYKETIRGQAYGVGHFEPLRHYAEAHLRLEEAERGSGLSFALDVSEDMLAKNWQRLILTHLEEKVHVGVLTGSEITDLKITVVAGRAHTKHTEGGDFRQATYRAVRQGLMEAESVLLEPYYDFRLEIPMDCLGRAMTDIDSMSGNSDPFEIIGETAVITGSVPVSTMRDYQITVNSYTKGKGRLTCSVKGYDICHNADEVIADIGYDPDADTDNPSSSVFCSHGAGMIVPWYEVHDKMHVECVDDKNNEEYVEKRPVNRQGIVDYSIDEEQIEAIINKTAHANEKKKQNAYKKQKKPIYTQYRGRERKNNGVKYLIVDGYNVVHAWDELKELVDDNIDGARLKLMDVLCNYQAFVNCEVILVFDAYRVKGNVGEFFDYNNIHVVYTKESQTADAYIEQLTNKMAKEYQVTVATSDGLVQLITRGQNCMVLSARELKLEIERVNEKIRNDYITDSPFNT